jgi:hypothetical protein
MTINDSHFKLAAILDKTTQEELFKRDETVFLPGLRKRIQIDAVFAAEDSFHRVENRRRQIRCSLSREKVAC